jgi:5-methyltetrahydrofolate--homocysteine methyltransferase
VENSFHTTETATMADLPGIASAVIDGKRDVVVAKVNEAITEGVAPAAILNEGLVAGMAVVGERFRKNEIYVPQVLIAARAMKGGMDVLEPKLVEHGVKRAGKVALGTVKGDLHDIGKNLVGMMLQGSGFEVVDLGTDVSVEKFLAAAKEAGADVIGMSALLTTTMPYMKQVVDAIKAAGLVNVRTFVGGAPVTADFAKNIAADGYAPDAASAVEVAHQLIGANAN